MLNTMMLYSSIPSVQSYFMNQQTNIRNNQEHMNNRNLLFPMNKKSYYSYDQLNTNSQQAQTLEMINPQLFNLNKMKFKAKNIKKENKHKKRIPKNIFTIEEDKKLIELKSIYENDWKKIADFMSNRTIRQCKERYNHYLSPEISSSQWTEEEDELLVQKVHEHGKRWKVLENFFDGRTEISIRNRWNMIERKQRKEIKKQTKDQLSQQKSSKKNIQSSSNCQNKSNLINSNHLLSLNDKSIKNNDSNNLDCSALPNSFHEDANIINNELNNKNTGDNFQNGFFKDDFSLEQIFDVDLNFENDMPQNFLS